MRNTSYLLARLLKVSFHERFHRVILTAVWLGAAICCCNPAYSQNRFVPQIPRDDIPFNSRSVSQAETSSVSNDDLWNQISELRTMVLNQEQEMLRMKSDPRAVRSIAPTSMSGKWFGSYENVIIQPIQGNNSALLVETNTGYSQVAFPWRMNYSPRVQFGREANCDSLGWRVRFWEFDHQQSLNANAANGLLPTGKEGAVPYLSEDGDITTGLAFIQSGTFTSRVRTDIIDWEVQKQLTDAVQLYAGIRYAKLAQGYQARTDQGNTDANSEFRGIGPTLALKMVHVLPLPRLALFSNLRGSLLFGHKEFSVLDNVNNIQQSLGTIDVRSFKDGGDTLSSNIEMQLGVRAMPWEFLAITVALECQHFTDVGGANPTAVFIGPDSGISGDSPLDDSLSFVGLVVGTDLYW